MKYILFNIIGLLCLALAGCSMTDAHPPYRGTIQYIPHTMEVTYAAFIPIKGVSSFSSSRSFSAPKVSVAPRVSVPNTPKVTPTPQITPKVPPKITQNVTHNTVNNTYVTHVEQPHSFMSSYLPWILAWWVISSNNKEHEKECPHDDSRYNCERR
jgi:hypothetical protein